MINREVLVNDNNSYILKTSNLNNDLILLMKINKQTKEFSLFDSNFDLVLSDFNIHIEYIMPAGKRVQGDVEYSEYANIIRDVKFISIDENNIHIITDGIVHSVPLSNILKVNIIGYNFSLDPEGKILN